MKKLFIKSCIVLLSVLALGVSANAEYKPMDVKSAEFVKSRMSPLPKKVELFNEYYNLKSNETINVSTPTSLTDAQKTKLVDTLKLYFGLKINLVNSVDEANSQLGEEGYTISINADGIKIAGNGFVAVRQALKTVRQMSEVA
ncbi:MAG: hypothetical protein E7035_00735, partial [Verrucomicrobiaceae bacterium]|nr:hypothetical protein [Verrucomicrobiaceae bacterium]